MYDDFVSHICKKDEKIRSIGDIAKYLDLKLGDVVDWEEYQEKGKKYARVRKLE